MLDEEIKEKVGKGWLHAKLFFEILGANEEVVKKSLAGHVEKLKRMDNIKFVSQKMSEVERVENLKGTDASGYSQIADVELLVNSLEELMLMVIFFGPSSVEILAPKEVRVGMESAQAMANAVAEMMHRYAAEGLGGIVISTKK